jgi:hypothetical protein
MDVLRIGIQAIYGFLHRDAHLSTKERTKRLLLERAKATVSHLSGEKTGIDQGGCVALSRGCHCQIRLLVGESIGWTVTTCACCCACPR